MDQKQILREIAFYSRYINQHKQQSKMYNQRRIDAANQTDVNKYKFVRKIEPSVIVPANISTHTSGKVLINPNFKRSVHINPHFNINKNIHINPKILNCKILNPAEYLDGRRDTIANSISKPILADSNLKPTRCRRSSLRSKYKIVKSSNHNCSVKPQNVSGCSNVKSKYKIDRRNANTVNKSLTKKKVFKQGISDLVRNGLFRNQSWKSLQVFKSFKYHNSNAHVTNISGMLYKKSKTKLEKIQSVSKTNRFVQTAQRRCILIKGQKYLMNSNKKTLRIISSTPANGCNAQKMSIKGLTYTKKATSVPARSGNWKKQNRQKITMSANRMRKNNQPCPVYRRFGKCRRKELGRCQFVHNPNQIFLCKKFLQGACVDDECLLSHKVSLEKMPACKYFLEGCCVRPGCPYLHVKVNAKAEICKQFLEGYCKQGGQCDRRHQFLCPDMEREGTCPRARCMYPHKLKEDTVVVAVAAATVETLAPLAAQASRYYADTDAAQVSVAPVPVLAPGECVRPDRPQLGTLPSFIPLV